MTPLPRYRNVAKRQFGEAGTEHILESASERSMAGHNAYFAAINDYFDNLPETIAPRFPTPTHFRRWLLIECGYFDERELTFGTEQNAIEASTYIRTLDEYARIHVHGRKLLIRRARSQSLKSMGKEEFDASKKAVLELAGEMTGISRTEAIRNAGRHA